MTSISRFPLRLEGAFQSKRRTCVAVMMSLAACKGLVALAAEAPTVGPVFYTVVPAGLGTPRSVIESPAVVDAGADVILQSSVKGTEPLALQWWFNGRLLDGATNAEVRLPS